jgi:hypothetical protein
MPAADAKHIISRFLLGFGMFFTLLALAAFAMPFIASATGSYKGGEQAIGSFFFTVASIFVRGWPEARAGYINLACLFGIPLLMFLAAVIHAGYDSVRHKSAA